MRSPMLRVRLWAAVAVGTAFLFAGCTAAPDGPGEAAPSPSPSPSTSVVDSTAWSPTPVPASAVLGRGTLESPEGAVTGTVEVVSDASGGAEFVLAGFASSDPRILQATFYSTSGATLGCYNPEGYAFSLPALGAETEQRLPMGRIDDFPSADPSFLDSVVVYAVPEPAEVGMNGCYGDVLAIAALSWNDPQNVPPAVDSGARAGASGTVQLTAGGTPLTYDVAVGDTLSAIAARFALDPAVILYLSAGRQSPDGMLDDEHVYTGETLKLDVSAR